MCRNARTSLRFSASCGPWPASAQTFTGLQIMHQPEKLKRRPQNVAQFECENWM